MGQERSDLVKRSWARETSFVVAAQKEGKFDFLLNVVQLLKSRGKVRKLR